ncbi:MAG: dTMP kinase [Deltaproteobacteria bacterium]|nr:dTMP kinase [Deltaproteobacteria bacterium]
MRYAEPMSRGRFYVIEGADGVGSTTQCQRLVDGLQAAGRRVHLTAEPSKGPIGLLIRGMLGGDHPRAAIHRELALLFAADRLDHVGREIEPLLASGVDVVSDRYVLSSLVYQSLDLPYEWVRELNKFAPAADATVLVTLPLDVAWARLQARFAAGDPREVFDVKPTQSQVHAEYERQARRTCAVIVDGRGTIDEVAGRVRAALSGTGHWPAA